MFLTKPFPTFYHWRQAFATRVIYRGRLKGVRMVNKPSPFRREGKLPFGMPIGIIILELGDEGL